MYLVDLFKKLGLGSASYPDVSLLMKMCAQRKAGRRQRARRRFACRLYPSHGPLRFITSHSFRARLCHAKNEAPEEEAGLLQYTFTEHLVPGAKWATREWTRQNVITQIKPKATRLNLWTEIRVITDHVLRRLAKRRERYRIFRDLTKRL